MSEIIFLVYSLLLVLGAFIGARAGSKISMIAGLTSGIMVLAGLWMAKTDPGLGYGFLSALTVLLSVMFAVRLIKTKKFMPSGMLLALSLIAAGCALLTLFQTHS